MAEAFGSRVTKYGDSASVQAVTRVNAGQASKRTLRKPTWLPPYRGSHDAGNRAATRGRGGARMVAPRVNTTMIIAAPPCGQTKVGAMLVVALDHKPQPFVHHRTRLRKAYSVEYPFHQKRRMLLYVPDPVRTSCQGCHQKPQINSALVIVAMDHFG